MPPQPNRTIDLRLLDPWLKSQVIWRSCGIGPSGTFRASLKWSREFIRRDSALTYVSLAMVGVLLIVSILFVLHIAPIGPFLGISALTLAALVFWLYQWLTTTASEELSTLEPVLVGTSMEKGYFGCVVLAGFIPESQLRNVVLEHLNYVLNLARSQPEERVWPLLHQHLAKIVEGGESIEEFEQVMAKVRAMFRFVQN